MKQTFFGKIFVTFVAIGVGVGIVGSSQLSESIRSGGLDIKGSGVGRAMAALFEPDNSVDDANIDPAMRPVARPTLAEQRPAVFAQVLRAPEPPAPISAKCAEPDTTATGTVIGDRLRLRFFEKTVLGGGQANENENIAEVAYERLDLSGTFEVGAEGEISIPLAGRIGVAGMTLDCVEQAVVSRMYEANRTVPQVSASYESRPAVTVRGAVRAPGSYQHGPGLTVERLLALAGSASDGGVQDAQHFLSLLARRAEFDRAELGLMLRVKRTRALLDGHRALDLSSDERSAVEKLLGQERLLLEADALAAEVDAIEARDADHVSRMKDLATLEDETLSMLRSVRGQYEDLIKRRDELVTLKERGFASAVQLDGISFNTISVEREVLDLQKALLEIKSEAKSSVQRANVNATEWRKILAIELRDLAEEQDSLRSRRATLEAELAMYESGLAQSGKGLQLSVEITRSRRAVTERLEAEPSTLLLPGDVVSVSATLPTALNHISADEATGFPANEVQLILLPDREIK